MGQALARGKTTAQIAEEAATAYQLQLAGWGVREIAEHLGISVGTVSNRLKAAARDRVHPLVDEMRRVQTGRLHAAHAALEPRIRQGDPAAVGASVRVSERLSRLWGLDMQPGAVQQAVEADESATAEVIADVLGDLVDALVDVAAADEPVWRDKLGRWGIEYGSWLLAGRPDGERPIPPPRPEPPVVDAEVFPGRLRPEQRAAMHDPSSPFYRLRTLLDLDNEGEVSDAVVVGEG